MAPRTAQRDPKGSPKGAQSVQKVDFLRYLWPTGTPEGPPKAHMVPFGKDFAHLGSNLDTFSIILCKFEGSFLISFDAMEGSNGKQNAGSFLLSSIQLQPTFLQSPARAVVRAVVVHP